MSNTEALRLEKLRVTPSLQWAAEARSGIEMRMELVLRLAEGKLTVKEAPLHFSSCDV